MGRPAGVKARQSTSSAGSPSDTSMMEAKTESRDAKLAGNNEDVSMVRKPRPPDILRPLWNAT